MANNVSDSYIFSGVATYFIAITFLLGLSPLAGSNNFLLNPSDAGSGGTPSGFSNGFKVATGVLCVGSAATVAAIAFFTGGIGLLGIGAVTASCGSFALSLTAPSNIADSINTIINGVFAFTFLFFQLLFFQLNIPGIINGLILAPGAAPMVYLGIKVLRGGG